MSTAIRIMSTSKPTTSKSLPQLLQGIVTAAIPQIEITDLTLDSRAVKPGSVFFALAGSQQHGLQFVPEAIAKGAAVIVWEPSAATLAANFAANISVIAVPHLREWLGVIADRFFDSPSAQLAVAAVTGTNGKTTSAYLIPAALSALRRNAGYAGTLGYGHIDALKTSAHTTADCITVHRQLAAMRDAGDTCVAMEVSSHALDQARIAGVRIHSALFTNLTRDHLDYHGTLEAYGAAKERLFTWDGLQHCVINTNDVFGREMLVRLSKSNLHAPLTAYSIDSSHCHLGDRQLFAKQLESTHQGLRIHFDGSWGAGFLQSRLIGSFNAENILGVLAVLLGMNVSLPDAVHALEQCNAPPGRMETLSEPDHALVVIDYAHTPDALAKALQTSRRHTRGKLICVFGCGGDRDAGKRSLMGAIAEQFADVVIVTDDNPRMEAADAITADILLGMSQAQRAIVEHDRAVAIERAIAMSARDDLVLIAGKGHEDYQIIGRNVKHFSDREVASRCLGQAT